MVIPHSIASKPGRFAADRGDRFWSSSQQNPSLAPFRRIPNAFGRLAESD
jgi:hypothetical protein